MEHLAEVTGCGANNGRTRRPILTYQTQNARGLFQYRLRGALSRNEFGFNTSRRLFPACFAFRGLRIAADVLKWSRSL
jgi:hypothetical protein